MPAPSSPLGPGACPDLFPTLPLPHSSHTLAPRHLKTQGLRSQYSVCLEALPTSAGLVATCHLSKTIPDSLS